MEAGPIVEGPTAAGPALDDLIPFWDYFQEFVYKMAISVAVKEQHKEICELYEAAILGKMPGYEYFLVHMPRRTGKTKILQALATWTVGEFSDAQLMYGCYSEKLVSQTIRYAAMAMQRAWYKELYTDIYNNSSSELITTTDGGMIYGAGMGAGAAGFGAGLKGPGGGYISLDDPANPRNYMSPVQRENVIEDFETAWKGCRNSDQWCPIFINAQRIGPDDLPGYVRATYPEKTFILEFPLRICLGEIHKPAPADDPRAVSAFPETWRLETLAEHERTRIGRFVVASQFQQQPIALGGNLIPVEDFRPWDPAEARAIKWQKLVITVDTALKTKEANDFSAAALWGLSDKRAYLIDLIHGKWEAPDLIKNVGNFYELHKNVPGWPRPRLVIEEKAAGTPLLQSLQKDGIPARGIERDTDKVRRVQNVLEYIESGMAVIPKLNSVPWIAKWLAEHSAFTQNMTHAHDDMVDTTVDAIEFLLAKKLSTWDVLADKPA